MKKRSVVISLAQIKYFDQNKIHNFDKIKKYIHLAKKKKADIVCFPESCIYREKNLRFDDKYLKEIREECKKNKIWCIISEDVQIKKKTYNLAILINREGKIIGNYKKINPWDEKNISSGKKIRVFKTDFAKIGIVICWDLAFPELFRKMKKAGAEIVFCPAQWAYEYNLHRREPHKKEKEILKSITLTRAFENILFVALVNPIRVTWDADDQISYTAVASPTQIIKEIFHKEGLLTVKLNLNLLKKIEKIYHV
jgi:predicted amidohydrolase